MHSSILLLAPLAVIAMASPLVKRATATNWQINGFSTFTPNAGSVPDNSSVSFQIFDTATNLTSSTQCLFTTTGNITKAADPTQFHPCDDSNFSFLWDGTHLTVVQLYSIAGGTFQAVTMTDEPAIFCIPLDIPSLGNGVQCETPVESFSGQWVALTPAS